MPEMNPPVPQQHGKQQAPIRMQKHNWHFSLLLVACASTQSSATPGDKHQFGLAWWRSLRIGCLVEWTLQDLWRDRSHHFTNGVHPSQASLQSNGILMARKSTPQVLYHTAPVPQARALLVQCELRRNEPHSWQSVATLTASYQCPNNTATASSHRNGKTQPTQGLGCTRVALTLSFPYAIPLWSSIEHWDCELVSRKSQQHRNPSLVTGKQMSRCRFQVALGGWSSFSKPWQSV